MPSVIEAAGLTKSYGSRRGIDGVTFAVDEGEVFGFLGPNGAGKTTTIRTLLGLLRPTDGSASIFGLDVWADAPRLHERLSYVGSDPAYLGELTAGRQLDDICRLRRLPKGIWRPIAERLELDPSVQIRKLSRGNRQKVGLILALFHEPDLLILDEPTSGLDPLMQEEFLALVREERERGCAVLISSHELDEVERVCDRVGIIRDGRLIAVERVADLLGKTPRRVSVEFTEPVDLEQLRSLPGVSELVAEDGRVSFRVSGDLDAVVKVISHHTVADLELAHPTLEEVFLTYYEDEGES